MKKVYFELESLDKIHEAARYFLNAVGDANIFAIDGDMGEVMSSPPPPSHWSTNIPMARVSRSITSTSTASRR